jgi:hypothetical protein
LTPAESRPETYWHSRWHAFDGFRTWNEDESVGLILAWKRDDDPEGGTGNLLFLFPMPGGSCGDPFIPAHARFLLDIDAEFHLGFVGMRLGVSPVQLADWLAGWFAVDYLGDDRSVHFAELTPEERAASIRVR